MKPVIALIVIASASMAQAAEAPVAPGTPGMTPVPPPAPPGLYQSTQLPPRPAMLDPAQPGFNSLAGPMMPSLPTAHFPGFGPAIPMAQQPDQSAASRPIDQPPAPAGAAPGYPPTGFTQPFGPGPYPGTGAGGGQSVTGQVDGSVGFGGGAQGSQYGGPGFAPAAPYWAPPVTGSVYPPAQADDGAPMPPDTTGQAAAPVQQPMQPWGSWGYGQPPRGYGVPYGGYWAPRMPPGYGYGYGVPQGYPPRGYGAPGYGFGPQGYPGYGPQQVPQQAPQQMSQPAPQPAPAPTQ